MQQPLVSIIIPAFNRADIIQQTLDSVLSQTYHNWECIIIDDRSTDDTKKIMESYLLKDSRFKFIEKKDCQKKGASASRNIGLYNSEGKYIQFLDSDDLMHPEKIEHQVNSLIQNDEFTIGTCKWDRIEISPLEIIKFSNKADYKDFTDTKEYFDIIGKYGGFFPPEAYLVSRKIIDFSGHWNENLSNNDDGEFFFRIISNASKIVFEEKSIVYHRKSIAINNNLSEIDSIEKVNSLLNSWKIIESLYVARYHIENSTYINKKKDGVYNALKINYKFKIKQNSFFFKNQIKEDNFFLKFRKLLKKIKSKITKYANRV